MQTKLATTSLGKAAKDYVTLVEQASTNVRGFQQLCKDMERAIDVSSKSKSTLTDDGRQLADLGVFSGECFPREVRSGWSVRPSGRQVSSS